MSERLVYLDHHSTTPVRPEVVEAMLPFWRGDFGNPNSVYALGQRSRKAVERARERVAALLGADDASEIVFTSGGSESNALAISGAAWEALDASRGKRRLLLSSRVEHDSVRLLLAQLRRRGFSADLAEVDRQGLVRASEVSALLGEETAVVSVMHANNEVGAIEPIAEIAKLCRGRGVLFHTDAVQSAGKVPIDVQAMGVDLLSISGHKLNAPKGIGALYVRKGARLSPLVLGHQEKNRRGGTENVAGIIGLGLACELAAKELPRRAAQCRALRDKLESAVLRIPGSRLNGPPGRRLPGCSHFSFSGLDGHQLVVALDLKGICVSSGPACSSGSPEPSHVLTAMGLPSDLARGCLRVSTGWSSTEADVDALLDVLPRAVEGLREVCAFA